MNRVEKGLSLAKGLLALLLLAGLAVITLAIGVFLFLRPVWPIVKRGDTTSLLLGAIAVGGAIWWASTKYRQWIGEGSVFGGWPKRCCADCYHLRWDYLNERGLYTAQCDIRGWQACVRKLPVSSEDPLRSKILFALSRLTPPCFTDEELAEVAKRLKEDNPDSTQQESDS